MVICVLYWSSICGSATDQKRTCVCNAYVICIVSLFWIWFAQKFVVTTTEFCEWKRVNRTSVCVVGFVGSGAGRWERWQNLQLKTDRKDGVATWPKSKYIKSDQRMRRYRNADNMERQSQHTHNVTKATTTHTTNADILRNQITRIIDQPEYFF